jgi:hypothetical protein
MKKQLFNKLFILASLFPAQLFAQDITGLWKGELFVDSTKKYLPYEISISEVKGKLVGYSHITFEENGKQETGIRDITIKRKDDEIIIEDVSLIDNSFSFVPPKNIKKTMVVTLSVEDTIMVLKGDWSTNRTKRFLSATGTVLMQRKNDFKSTVLYKRLADLKLADKLVFNEPEKKPAPVIAKEILPAPPVAIASKPVEEKNTAPVAAKQTISEHQVAVIKKPVEEKKASSVIEKETLPPPTVAVVTKPVVVNKAPAVISKPTPTESVVAKPVEPKTTAPVITKPAPIAAVITKPVEVKKQAPVPAKPPIPVPPVVKTPVTVARPIEITAVVAEKKTDPVIIPATAQGATDVNKRTIASTQSFFYQSDSLVLTLYDNGYVDGDTVSVVMNGELIFSRQGLSTKAVSKTIHITKETPDSIMLVMYAENLGSIPPNTGLLVVHDGEAIYDVRFSADLKTNAAIIFKRKKNE